MKRRKRAPGTITLRQLTALYKQSPEWGNIKTSSKMVYETGFAALEPIMDMGVDDITRPVVLDVRDELYSKPSVCRKAIAALRLVLGYGYERGYVTYNHAAGVRGMPKYDPYKRWTDEEIETFINGAPTYVGRAVMLALYTGQRRSDLVRLRWDQYDGRYIHLIQKKTGKELVIPVHKRLKKELDLMLEERRLNESRYVLPPYILLNYHGDPMSADRLSDTITQTTNALGIKNRCLHGLRKSTAAKLIEAGCTPHQAAAITGQSVSELEYYAREVSQRQLAEEAMRKWEDD